MISYVNCQLCPRCCGVDRTQGETGFCGCPDTALVAKTMLHKWEEPVLAGSGGSGAIFFGGCTLGCKYCQNRAISAAPTGTPASSAQLRAMMEDLIAQGAENIDLVTATQYLPTLIPALQPKLPVPVVYNCGGYERQETISALDGLVDIWLPDFKYGDNSLGLMLSGCKNYVNHTLSAIREMLRQVGAPQWDGEKLKKGVIIRHLILPSYVENSLKVLDLIGDHFGNQVLVSLMRQYTPMPGLPAPLDRPITEEEYQSVLSWMFLNDLNGFVQEESAATTAYIPDF